LEVVFLGSGGDNGMGYEKHEPDKHVTAHPMREYGKGKFLQVNNGEIPV